MKNLKIMKSHFSFSESFCWQNAVNKTYPLKNETVVIENQTIHLYGNGSMFSNSPYITDGGFYKFDGKIEEADFGKLKKPVLIKSRNQIVVSEKVPHVLDLENFTFLIDLQKGKEYVWQNLIKSKTRNQVRKAEKCNYEIKIGKLELVEDFYKVISRAWLDLGTPTHSKDFYKNIITQMSDCEKYQARLMVIYIDQKPASCACLIYDDYSIHHPYAATLKKYNHLSLNNALYWNIIQFAIEKNIAFFDLGRSKETQTTAVFKKSWGAEPVQLYYYYFNKAQHENEEDNKIVKILINLWKKLPISVANFLGPKLIYKVLK